MIHAAPWDQLMPFKYLTTDLAVSPQIEPDDVAAVAAAGFKSILANRPDQEGAGQPEFAAIAREAEKHGLVARYMPVVSGAMSSDDARAFAEAMDELPKPVLAYCRSGTRCAMLWGWSEAGSRAADDIVARGADAGYDLRPVAERVLPPAQNPKAKPLSAQATPLAAQRAPRTSRDGHTVVIVGGGAAGAGVAASLLKRSPDLDIAIIEPADTHYYQPGWTLVGGGIFDAQQTAKPMASVLPRGVTWIKGAVTAFEPDHNIVRVDACGAPRTIAYDTLVVCPGLKLDWAGIDGLTDTLGQNGVTSNYRYDLAPYTWDLVQKLKSGRAIFTQPPLPIKCAGAPQKAMYLSADHWLRNDLLKGIDVGFYNAGGVLFGVADYVPALMEYISKYDIALKFGHTLMAVDGPNKRATFKSVGADGAVEMVETTFDMLHVCPPQTAPDFIRSSPLADAGGWVDVDPHSLRHARHANIFGLGDVTNTPNAKTAAAARKQAPVVAQNVLHALGKANHACAYDGYGSCPLTVERGKIVLAEFAYGGKVCPSFPRFVIDGTRPSRAAWLLKERVLPPVYWRGMLKGREWMAKPKTAT